MNTLQPNPLAIHHSRAFSDLKKGRPDQADLLISKHNVGETVTAHKQATSTHQKNTEQNARYLLSIMTIRKEGPQASNRHPKSKK